MLHPANKYLLNSIRNHSGYTFISLCLSLGSAILDIVGIALFIFLIAVIYGNYDWLTSANHFIFIKFLAGLTSPIEPKIAIISLLLFAVFTIKNLAEYLNKFLGYRYTATLVAAMQRQTLELLCNLGWDFYQKTKAGDVLFKLNREIDRTALAIKSVQNLLVVSLTASLLAIILTAISWQSTLIATMLLLFKVVSNKWLNSLAETARLSIIQKNKISTHKIVEFLAGIRWIKAVAYESIAAEAIARSLADKNQAILTAQSILAVTKTSTAIWNLTIVLVLTIASYYLYPEPIVEFAPVVSLYLIVLWRLLPLLDRIDYARRQFAQMRPSLEVVANFLSVANQPATNTGKVIFSQLQTGIEFETVTFAYPQARIILDDISFKIPVGKTTVVVGSHKSDNGILGDLLMRFYEPIAGKILLDGREIEQYQLASLRKAVGVISRDAFLFDDSLANNIAYGLSNVSQTDIIEAARQARLYCSSQLPEGLSTQIGASGTMLSEVQRLKVSFARAFLRNPQILIINQPIKELDRQPVIREITEIITALCRDRTTAIVTQQPLALKADRIIVLDRGKIAERGTHQQLLRSGSIYPRLYGMRFKTSQQSRQVKLAQKIAQKLARQPNSSISSEIRYKMNALLDKLQLINEGVTADEGEQNQILDESYQSAKNMLLGLREYEQKISRKLDDLDRFS